MRIRIALGIVGVMATIYGCGGGSGSGSGSAPGPTTPPPAPPPEPPAAVTLGDGVLIDAPRELQHRLSNPILVVNENGQAMIAYTVDAEVRAAYFDGTDWRHITTLFSGGETVLVGTGPTIQMSMNDHGQAALVVQLDSRAIPQEPGRQLTVPIGIAYFDGTDWVHAEIIPGHVTMKLNGDETTDAIGLTEDGMAFLAYERPVPSPIDDHLVDGRFSILTFDATGIQDSWDFGDERWFYHGAYVSMNDFDEVAVLFAGTYWQSGTRVDDPLLLFNGNTWDQLPSPPRTYFYETHFFYNNNGTAALFLESGLFGYGFDGSQWTEFEQVPDFGARRNKGHTVRTGETAYTFVTTFEDTSTSTRHYEVYDYDLFGLQSSRTISDNLTTAQPRARLFRLSNGRLYLTEHGIEAWVEDGSGSLSAPEALLLTEFSADSDVQVNQSGFGIIADNSLGILEARTLRVR